MPKDEWGVKRVCPACSTRFYDLQRDPMTCPNCGAVFDLESLTSKKGASVSRPDKKEPTPASVTADTSSDEEVVLDDDDDSDVDIEDDLLDDDEDDSVDLEEIADVSKDDDES